MSAPRPTPGSKACVLVVEDEPQLRRLLRVSFSTHGYRVLEAERGELALELAAQHLPDVVVLDLGLPDIDGVEVARRLRAWSTTPIVVLSARHQEPQKVEALDAGADDYVTKPFGFDELQARIRVALRHATRSAMTPASVFQSGPLRIDFERRRVFLDEHEVHLTRIEYNLLTTLAQNAGRVVTHRQLLEAVWGPHHGRQNHYLRVYMTHLRRKLDPDPMSPRLFTTEAGVGYRLHADDEAP